MWEETTAILANPLEVDAQEALRIQVWDIGTYKLVFRYLSARSLSDYFTADGPVGMVDIPLSELMHSSRNPEPHNGPRRSIMYRQFRSQAFTR